MITPHLGFHLRPWEDFCKHENILYPLLIKAATIFLVIFLALFLSSSLVLPAVLKELPVGY